MSATPGGEREPADEPPRIVTRTCIVVTVAQPWPGMILGFFAAHASASSLPGRTPLRVAVCLVGELRSAAQTAPSIRRHVLMHVLDVLDAEAFLVSQISNWHRGLNQSLAIERLLGPRVRRDCCCCLGE